MTKTHKINRDDNRYGPGSRIVIGYCGHWFYDFAYNITDDWGKCTCVNCLKHKPKEVTI
jgi:hypothetical protein